MKKPTSLFDINIKKDLTSGFISDNINKSSKRRHEPKQIKYVNNFELNNSDLNTESD